MSAGIGPLLRWAAAWMLAATMLTLRATCRIHLRDDPRPRLRDTGEPYAYAILHAHQVAAIMVAEAGTCAMVSRNADGALILPMLRVRRVTPVRGSTRKKDRVDRGGAKALGLMTAHIRAGQPGYLAVDGPRGPRGIVNRGIGRLAHKTGAAIVVAIAVPRSRWIVTKAWDRMQIPKPFTRVDVYFGAPLRMEEGETEAAFCLRIAAAIAALELRHDPSEADAGVIAHDKRRTRLDREDAACQSV